MERCLFHLYERPSLVTRRTEVRLRGEAFFGANARWEQPERLSCWKVGAPGLLAPSPRARLPCPASEARSCGAFLSVKRLTAYGSVNFVSWTSQKRTLGGDVYRDPRATEAPLLLSEGASHGAGPAETGRRVSEASSNSLARIEALLRRRSLASRAGAHPYSTPIR